MIRDIKYRKPPVIEALCELYFNGSEWDDTIPGRFFEIPLIKGEFPNKQQQDIHEAQVTFAEGHAVAGVRRLPPRIQFLSNGGGRMIQLARDLLVINQLKPYPKFEEWEPFIYSSLHAYQNIASPKTVAQVGVRYINRVVIPGAKVFMEDYFALYPQLPKTIGEGHGAFMLRLEIPAKQGHHGVLVTFGSAPAEQVGEHAFLLDIYDIFRPISPLALENVQEEVRIAHSNVEAAFESSITDRLRALFEPEERA